MCRRAMTASEGRLGAEHAVTLRLRTSLAGIKFSKAQVATIDATPQELMVAQKLHEEAIRLYQTVYDARRKLLGSDHEDTLNVGSALKKLQKMQRNPYSPFVRSS